MSMEIFPNVHQIPSRIADRNLFQYLFVGENSLLLDTGFASTPADVIIPYLENISLPIRRVTMAINTHADADHHGGNRLIKERSPETLLACGELDRAVIEDPDRLFETRYNQWLVEHKVGLGSNAESEAWVKKMTGPRQRIDLTLSGGEHVAIDEHNALRVLHLPGHSHGHLGFYHPGHRAIFVGDALHGSACPSADGKPSLPPAYFAVLAYLSTLQTVHALRVDWIYSAHWPTYNGSGAKEFLAECRSFVDRADAFLREELARHPEGVTLGECMQACVPALGNWPPENRWLLMYPVYGHLELLEQLGITSRGKTNTVTRWKLKH
jgi:glyoxylase-like metal-dependent hydrolase (beta-lactamase superfamily II)